MTEAEEFIYNYENDQLEIMRHLHDLLVSENQLIAKIRYGLPFYYGKSWICYLNPKKNGLVEFAFIRGNELSNDQGLLNSQGRKQVFSVEFEHVNDIPFECINEIIQEAILLDETTPYQTKRTVSKRNLN